MQYCRILALLLALCLLAGLCACNAEQPVPQTSQPTEETDKFAVGQVTPVSYGASADIYLPETAIVNPPTVVQTITAQTGFPDAARPCAVAILHIDDQLNVVEGDRVLTTADTFLGLYRDRVIPAFYIDSDAEAEALIAYLEKNDLVDAYVMAHSSQADLVYKVRDSYRRIQGALWFDRIADAEARREAQLLANRSLAMVLCCAQPLSAEDMLYFNARLLSVWNCVEDTASVYAAVANGSNGVIGADTNCIYDVYESLTGSPIVCGQTVVIGHRGAYGYLENTLASFRKAREEYHCNAIELDLRLSGDGEIVIMHDDSVDRTTTGTGKVAKKTLQELKALQVTAGGNGDTDAIPTFEEVLQEFAGTDLVLVCHMNVRNDTMMNRFNALVAQYDCQDQVIAFLGYTGRTDYNYTNYASGIAFAAGTQEDVLADKDPLKVVNHFMRYLVTYHYQPLFYDYVTDDGAFDHGNPEFYYQMSARGFLNWHSTTTGASNTDKTLLIELGAAAALLNDATLAGNYTYYIDAEGLNLQIGQKLPAQQTAIGQSGTQEVTCGYWQLDGDPLQDGTLNAAGTVTIVYYADLQTDTGHSYRIISQPVTVQFS